MGEIRKINPYDFSTVAVDEAIEAPREVKNFIGRCPKIGYTDMSPEEAKRLRLENVSILNEIINDVTVSATTRVQAIQAREKIVKDLMGNVGTGINQRTVEDLRTLLYGDDDNNEVEFKNINTNETDSRGHTSIDVIKQQMLDDSEED